MIYNTLEFMNKKVVEDLDEGNDPKVGFNYKIQIYLKKCTKTHYIISYMIFMQIKIKYR